MARVIELPQDPDQFRAEWEYLLAKFKRDELTPAEEARYEEFEDENDLRYSLAQLRDLELDPYPADAKPLRNQQGTWRIRFADHPRDKRHCRLIY